MFWQRHDDDDEENTFLVGVSVFAVIFLFLLSLAALRILTGLFIDVAIVGDTHALTRFLGNFYRHRMNVPHSNTRNNTENNQEMPMWVRQSAAAEEIEADTIDQVLARLTQEEKQYLVSTLLKSKIKVVECVEDIQQTSPETVAVPSGGPSQSEPKPSSHRLVCPICIHDLFSEDQEAVMLCGCSHCFHRDCLSQWLCTQTRGDCPYCRKEIGLTITRDVLEQFQDNERLTDEDSDGNQ